jgi:dipeptidyl aminopeptidase/acylaminoacyl peptidase
MPDLTGVPPSLKLAARWMRLAGVPALVMHPDFARAGDGPRVLPWLLWMHGRTVTKEIDPGRFQRMLRAGMACVAVDLPGHGERFEPWAHQPEHTLAVITRMVGEIDAVVDAVHELGGFDLERSAIGGMSAGGMAAMARLCRPHRFRCAAVECSTGSWRGQPNLLRGDAAAFDALNPIEHLDGWRSIPFLALHNRFDEWVPLAGQEAFVAELRRRAPDPSGIELHVYERTGAPFEHAGFGRMGADAKDRLVAFLGHALAR